MTKFWRNSFYRVSTYGVKHWVEGHWVDRYDWSRYGSGSSNADYARNRLEEYRVGTSSTARFVNPNASCPVCGAPVFFYQNEHGSRVYFDELGPPWPKHPCTDDPSIARHASRPTSAAVARPEFRSDDEISEIVEWLRDASVSPEAEFENNYGTKPWTVTKLIGRFRGKSGVFFVLSATQPELGKKLFMFSRRLPGFLKHGAALCYKRGTIAFFDPNVMEPKELPVRRIRNAAIFIDELAADKGARAEPP